MQSNEPFRSALLTEIIEKIPEEIQTQASQSRYPSNPNPESARAQFVATYFDDPAAFVNDCFLWNQTHRPNPARRLLNHLARILRGIGDNQVHETEGTPRQTDHTDTADANIARCAVGVYKSPAGGGKGGQFGSPTPYQSEILTTLATSGRIAVRGPHGLGKTTLAAWAVIWFAFTRDAAGIDWKIPTTASAWRQLSRFLWPEIRSWARRLDWNKLGYRGPLDERKELLDLSLKLSTGEAFALASDNSALIEGAHAAQLLYLFDEARTIPADTWDSAEGAFAAGECYWLAVSTPGEPNGRFYDIHRRRPGYEDWSVRHVSLPETIAAGRITEDWAIQRKRQWGEHSAVYQNRVLGQFATNDSDSIIPLSWVEAANNRWERWQKAGSPGPVISLGVDIGISGDRSVIAIRYQHAIDKLRYLPKGSTMQTAGHVAVLLRAAAEGRLNRDPTASPSNQPEQHHESHESRESESSESKSESRHRGHPIPWEPTPTVPSPEDLTFTLSMTRNEIQRRWQAATEYAEQQERRNAQLAYAQTNDTQHPGAPIAQIPGFPTYSPGGNPSPNAQHPAYAVIDVIGIGAGVVHRLKEQAFEIMAFNAAERAEARGIPILDATGHIGFINKRAAGWWALREALDPDNPDAIALPPDDILTADLTAPHYEMTSTGCIKVEAKAEVKQRLGRSTDAADAVMHALFPRPKRRKLEAS